MDRSDKQPLAYVFWHWPSTQVDAAEYELRQQAFHDALRDAPPHGFRRSLTHAIDRVPWSADGVAAYEDWYLVDDFAALGVLNEAAVSASRRAPHDSAAAHAAGGTAGIFGLRLGRATTNPTLATWFAKPSGMSYETLFAQLSSELATFDGGLWMRQMTLGPGTEFCLLGAQHSAPTGMVQVQQRSLRPVWPRSHSERAERVEESQSSR